MILEEETFEKFGYYPSKLKSRSVKKILVKCDECGKVRISSKDAYRALCRSCGRRGSRSHRWKGGKVKAICRTCGKIFPVYPSKLKWGTKYCSRICARKKQKRPTHHTKPERIFEQICKKNNLPFKYVGDGSFWIERINPDFIETNGKNTAVEIFGDYWHSPLLNRKLGEKSTLTYRKRALKKHGWKLVVFWESDLKRVDAEQFVLLTLKSFL